MWLRTMRLENWLPRKGILALDTLRVLTSPVSILLSITLVGCVVYGGFLLDIEVILLHVELVLNQCHL